jgi:hypothetical protein
MRPAGAPPLELDNEPDDIHSDGVQVYVAGGGPHVGYLIVPDASGPAGGGGKLRVATTSDATGDPRAVTGSWRATERGYRVTARIAWPALGEGVRPHLGAKLGFDLLVNEMLPGRVRRAGQLVWSGGNGWVWLRGDRQDPARFGTLELVT